MIAIISTEMIEIALDSLPPKRIRILGPVMVMTDSGSLRTFMPHDSDRIFSWDFTLFTVEIYGYFDLRLYGLR